MTEIFDRPQMMWGVAAHMAVVGVGIYCLPSPRRPTDAAHGAEHGASKGKLSGFRDSRGGRCGRAMVASAAVLVFFLYVAMESGYAGFIAAYTIQQSEDEPPHFLENLRAAVRNFD